jgi:hypothetical protein
MVGWMVRSVVLTFLAGAFAPPDATALCNCTDVDGCFSAAACASKNPGDDCTPPRNATCKIVKQDAGGLACCCGCSRGSGPLSCVYEPVVAQLARFDGVACDTEGACVCDDRKIAKRTRRTTQQVGGKLSGAEKGCAKGKDPTKKTAAAAKKLDALGTAIDRLVEKNKATPECATALKGLASEFGVALQAAERGDPFPFGAITPTPGFGPTPTPTPTGDVGCTGGLFIPPGFPNERDFQFACTGPGTASFTAFRLVAPNGYQFVNQIDPPGFTCVIEAGGNPNDTFACTGPFGFGVTIEGGRVAISPTPSAPFVIDLTVQNGGTFGPFPLE